MNTTDRLNRLFDRLDAMTDYRPEYADLILDTKVAIGDVDLPAAAKLARAEDMVEGLARFLKAVRAG